MNRAFTLQRSDVAVRASCTVASVAQDPLRAPRRTTGARLRTRQSKNSLPCRAQQHGYSSTPANADAVRDFDGRYGGGARRTGPTNGAASSQPSMESLLADLSPEEVATVKLFQECSQSVVNVSTTVNTVRLFPFNMAQIPRGVGSGFIWDTKGHIITNAHVIQGAAEVNITLLDQTVAKAKVIGSDREKDIAVLKLELPQERLAQLKSLRLGVSSNLLVGQKVYAIGNPFGLDQTLTQGIVSGLGREIQGNPLGVPISNVIQTDAAINPGNSGGPLLDSKGRVLGINTAILDPTGVGISSGVGFAIPIDSIKGMVEQILTVGRVVRPALGISIAPVPEQLKRKGLAGVLVASVRTGGPADVAGVQGIKSIFGGVTIGDIITAINGKKLQQQKDLFATLDSYRVGDSVELTLARIDGSTRTVKVTLADRARLHGSE